MGDGGRAAWQALVVAPWKLPLAVIAIAVPIALGFYVGGPGIGVAVGALVAVAIVVIAVRQDPRGAIGEPAADARRRLLVVVSWPLEDPRTIRTIAGLAGGADSLGPAAEVLVLSPARIGFLDRWASDVEAARRRAQERLVVTVASLAKAGVVAEARVGDEDVVRAVEDQLQTFAANIVVLVTGSPEEDPAGEQAAVELARRLRAEFRRLAVSGPAAR